MNTNKIWNFARFVDLCLTEANVPLNPMHTPQTITAMDAWVIDRLNQTIESVTHHIDDYNFAAAADELWEFTWNQCCDWYVEGIKLHRNESLPTLVYVCYQTLILLHPFLPFVTEAIWKTLSKHPQINENDLMDTIQHAAWPKASAAINHSRLDNFSITFNVIREIRHLIKASGVSTKKELTVILSHPEDPIRENLITMQPLIQKLTKVTHATIQTMPETLDGPHSQSVASTIEIQLLLPDIDVASERKRLNKQLAQLQDQHNRLNQKLGNNQFTAKAPPAVVQKVQTEFDEVASEIHTLEQQIAKFT